MKTTIGSLFLLLLLLVGDDVPAAQERVEIESVVIKGNKEFPQILYIVPWKDMKSKGETEQTLVLHSLFGDLFDPVYQLPKDKPAAPATRP